MNCFTIASDGIKITDSTSTRGISLIHIPPKLFYELILQETRSKRLIGTSSPFVIQADSDSRGIVEGAAQISAPGRPIKVERHNFEFYDAWSFSFFRPSNERRGRYRRFTFP